MNHLDKIKLKHFSIMIFVLCFMMVFPCAVKATTPALIKKKTNPVKTMPSENLKFTAFNITENILYAGNSFKASATVTNLGEKSSGSYVVNFYIAKDLAGRNNATLLKAMLGSPISQKTFKKYNTSLTVPAKSEPGTWYIVVRIEQSKSKSVKDSKAKSLIVFSKKTKEAKEEVSISGDQYGTDTAHIDPE